MSKSVHTDGRQMQLDFSAKQFRAMDAMRDHCNVLSFQDYAKKASSLVQPAPELLRLLREAKKLNW